MKPIVSMSCVHNLHIYNVSLFYFSFSNYHLKKCNSYRMRTATYTVFHWNVDSSYFAGKISSHVSNQQLPTLWRSKATTTTTTTTTATAATTAAQQRPLYREYLYSREMYSKYIWIRVKQILVYSPLTFSNNQPYLLTRFLVTWDTSYDSGRSRKTVIHMYR